MTSLGRARRSLTDERDDRLAFFDAADRYTPYLAASSRGSTFLLKTEDKHIARSLFGKQARGEMAVLDRAVGAVGGLLGADAVAGRAFIDVGANIGTTAIPALISHGFSTAVAIEPEPENVRVLRLNVILNELDERIQVLPVAVSDQLGHSDLVVTRDRGGKHWIATDPKMIKPKRREDSEVISVETVTLDHLVATGVIDPESVGMLWMDAEAHEGHILEGAGELLARGTPTVLEWNPAILDRIGDRGKLERAITANYTHFAAMHRNPDPSAARFPLQAVDRISSYAERFLEQSASNKTDVLVLRLRPDQVPVDASLDAVISEAASGVAKPRRRLLSRVRSRLLGRR